MFEAPASNRNQPPPDGWSRIAWDGGIAVLNQIDHIVVLMLENRSFDCLLGKLYPPSPQFDGLTGAEFNVDAAGNQIKVWNQPGTDPVSMVIPDPDPGELWTDINTQLFGKPDAPAPGQVPTMEGFVRNYLTQTDSPVASYVAKNIMHYFQPDQVPVISSLARQFAVSDRWFASAPCQTWPNRFFAHTATANGYENNDPTHFPYTMPTIFNRLEQAGIGDWKIYFHDIAQSQALSELWLLADHFHFYQQFRSDAQAGSLPAYSFIEPRYFADWTMPNDQHPPHNVTMGEQLIADVYNSLRAGPQWTKTLLIITYDEHGGCYDHVPPPKAVPPSATASQPFNFDRYGVRVPAVLISPYIPPGTVLRPPGTVPFDHTSIISTLRARFPQLGPALTDRDAAAPDLSTALTLPAPTNLGPTRVNALPFAASPTVVAKAQASPLNHMQEGLVKLAANLPKGAVVPTGTAMAPMVRAAVRAHIDNIAVSEKQHRPIVNVGDGAAFVKQQLGQFFTTN
jgi:phospholipase C